MCKALKYCFIIVFVFIIGSVKSQSQKELEEALTKTSNDSNKVEILLQIADLNSNKPTLALEYSNKAKLLAEKTNYPLLKYLTTYITGIYNTNLGNYKTSLSLYHKSIEYLIPMKFNLAIADVYSDIATVFKIQEKWDSCLYYNYKAIDIRKKENDIEGLGKSYHNLALFYRRENDYDNARLFFLKAIPIFLSLNNYEDLAKAYTNYGLLFKAQQHCDSAVLYFNKAIPVAEKAKNARVLNTIKLNSGLCLNDLKKYNEALTLFNDLLKNELENNEEIYPWLMYGLGECNIGLKSYNEGIEYLLRATKLKYKNSELEHLGQVNLALANAYENLNLHNEALYHFKKYKAISDSLYNFSKLKDVNLLKTKYETKEKEQAIELLSKENLLKDLSIKEKQQNLMLSILKNKQNEQQINLLNKDNELKDFSLKDKQKSLQLSQLKINEQQQQVTILNKENLLKEIQLQERKRNIIYTTIGLVLLGILALAALWMYRSKRNFSNALAQKNEIISTSLREKEILLKEIHHRVKNNLQVISSLLNLQSKSITDETALQALNEGKNRVKSMALIHQNLYRDDNLTGVDVKDYIEKLASSLFNSYNIENEKIKLNTEIESLQIDVDTIIPLGLILNELMSNALKYAFINKDEGQMQVSLKQMNQQLVLCVQDDGIGIDKDDLNKSNTASIGHKLIQSFLQKLDATLSIEKNNGTKITLIINKFKLT